MQISELWIYPIKSLAGISVATASLTDRGFQHDRRWMLINEAGRFLSQRELPEMAVLQPKITPQGLEITHRLKPLTPLLIPFVPLSAQPVSVSVWDDTLVAWLVDEQADGWFSMALGRPIRLVHLPDEIHRSVDPKYAHQGEITSLADAFPYLLAGQSSLDALNAHLTEPVPMNRFRPNLVVTGAKAFEEDEWDELQVGNLTFSVVKPCARCPIPGIDQQTAQRSPEVIKILAKYRQRGHKVYFGQNLLTPANTGILNVGDELIVLSRKVVEGFLVKG